MLKIGFLQMSQAPRLRFLLPQGRSKLSPEENHKQFMGKFESASDYKPSKNMSSTAKVVAWGHRTQLLNLLQL